MRKQRGFTLIELLVVIAIIAVLMSILMPALSKIRLQAQSVADMSNQHQFALTWKFYTDDHDGLFPTRDGIHDWPQLMLEYMGGTDTRIWLCPAATKPWIEGGRYPNAAWDDDVDLPGIGEMKAYGSYAVNLWCANTKGLDPDSDNPIEYFWQTPNIRGSAFGPMLMDGNWSNTEPLPDDEPWATREEMVAMGWEPNANEMKRVCMDRHGWKVNACFLDLSVKTTGLKELWTLKWTRKWPTTCDHLPVWEVEAPWLDHLPDPCPAVP
jgi:prepilin-type N-terminal cleavage/methylation domain-containing protein